MMKEQLPTFFNSVLKEEFIHTYLLALHGYNVSLYCSEARVKKKRNYSSDVFCLASFVCGILRAVVLLVTTPSAEYGAPWQMRRLSAEHNMS